MRASSTYCATPDPEPSWPDTARGTSIVVSTRAPSTFAPTDIARSQHPPSSAQQQPLSSAHHTESVSTMDTDVRASNTDDHSDETIENRHCSRFHSENRHCSRIYMGSTRCKVHFINEI